MTRDASQHKLDLPSPHAEIGPQRQAAPRMRKVTRHGGQNWYAWTYRGVDEPRLGRMDHFTTRPRSKRTQWFVDDEPAASLPAALAKLSATPAPIDKHPAVVAVREAFPEARILGERDLPATGAQEREHDRRDAREARQTVDSEAAGRPLGLQPDHDLRNDR